MFWILRRVVLVLAVIVGFWAGRSYEQYLDEAACGELGGSLDGAEAQVCVVPV